MSYCLRYIGGTVHWCYTTAMVLNSWGLSSTAILEVFTFPDSNKVRRVWAIQDLPVSNSPSPSRNYIQKISVLHNLHKHKQIERQELNVQTVLNASYVYLATRMKDRTVLSTEKLWWSRAKFGSSTYTGVGDTITSTLFTVGQTMSCSGEIQTPLTPHQGICVC